MCGRYELFERPDLQELQSILRTVRSGHREHMPIKTGEIFPTNLVPILENQKGAAVPIPCIWGFPGFQNKGILINARAETAANKPTFQKSLLNRRCVIPSTGFFEWKQEPEQKKKRKYKFNRPNTSMLYLAGFWNAFGAEKRFVILTTKANSSMEKIHDRMPVILDKSQFQNWLQDTDWALEFLKETPPILEADPVVN